MDFRFYSLPLVRDNREGERVQVCALVFEGGQPDPELGWTIVVDGRGERRTYAFKTAPGQDVPARKAAGKGPAPARFYFEIPAVSERQAIGVRVIDRRSGEVLASRECEAQPVRPWRVFVVHHSHLDIGYTHVQDRILHLHTAFIDEAVHFADLTRDWPEDARFRWTIEAGYPLAEYCKRRGASEVNRLVACIRRGQIELTAFACNLHAETCSLEELARSLYDTHEFAERWGFKIRSAMQSDVPGQPWSLPQLLADCGVRYLSLAPNNHRAPVHAHRKFDRPFYWRTRDGQDVLTWFTDDPVHVYQEGNVLGFIDSYEAVLERLPWKLAELETTGFPYDALHLRCQGSYADNGPPNLKIAEVIRRWNEEWVWPKVRMATNWEFFDYMERRHKERIPVCRGDWPDWWADGTGSAAREMSLVRESHVSLRTGGAIAGFVDLAEKRAPEAGAEGRRLREHLDDLVQEMILFDEHTWGAARPEADEWEGFGSQGRQWSLKSAHAHRARAKGSAFEEAALAAWGRFVKTGEYPTAVIFNSVAQTRRDVVTLELPRWLGISGETRLSLRDRQTGELIPYEWIPPKTHDRAAVRFVSPAVPALGYATVEIRTDGTEPAESHARRRSEHAPLAIQNAFYRLRLDLEKSGVDSLVDRKRGVELLDDFSLPFNGYIYDHYVKDDERDINHRLIVRHVPDRAAFVGLEETPIESALVYQFRGGEGAEKVVCRLRLFAGLPVVEVENAVHKIPVPHKEGGYFLFPFRRPRAVYYNVPGGEYRVDGEHGEGDELPGARADWLVVESGVYLPGDEVNVAWASLDAPLVELGGITTVQPPRPAPKANGHIYSYVFNNLWSTNFKPRQGGELRYRYRVTSQGVDDIAGFANFAQSALHPLVARVLPAGQEGRFQAAAGTLLEVEGEGVVVDSLVPAKEGGILVRLREVRGASTEARLGLAWGGEVRAARVDPVEREIAPIPASGGAAKVAIGAYRMVHVRIG